MSKASMVSDSVSRGIGRLNAGDPASTAMMARLRRGVGKTLTESPDTWEMVLAVIPEELMDNSIVGTEPTESESAVHSAMTLYAMHQQSKGQCVNQSGVSFGRAVGRLARGGNEEAVKRRFNAVITSSDVIELTYHVRGLVQLMRSSEPVIGFDYPQFAKDLYNYQFPDGKRNVILRWGQDFYRIDKEE